ncbi:Stf0 family sulfotransferase [Aestuariivirga sp.]|uniref:Stf0 family sulfotransferase n=1 Tax=Aestuariivirga sp. TaxID=2650926 RepID=UPI0035B3FE68
MSTPRCGSSLFCSSLQSTNLFGHPSEWFNVRHIEDYGQVWGLPNVHIGRYLNHIIERTTTPNGVFSVNFHVGQYDFWKRQNFDLMSLKFDKIIYVYRRDKIAQAHSYARALKTDQWQTLFAAREEVGPEGISTALVLDLLSKIVEEEQRFTQQFAPVITARYAYEDYAVNPEIYRDALKACGIDCPPGTTFSTDLGILRNAADEARVAEIKAYVTGQAR